MFNFISIFCLIIYPVYVTAQNLVRLRKFETAGDEASAKLLKQSMNIGAILFILFVLVLTYFK